MDTVLEEHQINPTTVGIIKMDTQGTELDILKGASFTKDLPYEKKPWIMLEVSYVRFNMGQPLLTDVIIEMDSIGYKVLEIPYCHCQTYESTKIDIYIQADMLFVPKQFFTNYDFDEYVCKVQRKLKSIEPQTTFIKSMINITQGVLKGLWSFAYDVEMRYKLYKVFVEYEEFADDLCAITFTRTPE